MHLGVWTCFPFTSIYMLLTVSLSPRLDTVRTARIGTLTMFFAALLVSAMWRPSAVHGGDTGEEPKRQLEHAFSGGVVFSIIMLAAGMGLLNSHLVSDL